MHALRVRAALFFLLGGAALPSCGSSKDTPPPAKFSEVYAALFPRATHSQCDFCHALPPNLKSNGNLSTGTAGAAVAYAALVGKSSTSSACEGRVYVVPGQPESSLLYQKLTSPPCGDHMPLGGDPLTGDQLEMVHSWIAGGARND